MVLHGVCWVKRGGYSISYVNYPCCRHEKVNRSRSGRKSFEGAHFCLKVKGCCNDNAPLIVRLQRSLSTKSDTAAAYHEDHHSLWDCDLCIVFFG